MIISQQDDVFGLDLLEFCALADKDEKFSKREKKQEFKKGQQFIKIINKIQLSNILAPQQWCGSLEMAASDFKILTESNFNLDEIEAFGAEAYQ